MQQRAYGRPSKRTLEISRPQFSHRPEVPLSTTRGSASWLGVSAVRGRYPCGVDKALNGVTGEAANLVERTLRQGGRMVDLTESASEVPPVVFVD